MTLNVLRFGWSGAATTLVALGVCGAVGCDGDRFIGEGPKSVGGSGPTSTGSLSTTGVGASPAQVTSTGAGGIVGQSTSSIGTGGTPSVGGTSVGGTNVGGAAGSTGSGDPCKGLEGDWSVTPVVKAVNAKLAAPYPTVGSERNPVGLRLTKKDVQTCSLELMPRWSPSWNADLVGSADRLAFDLKPDQMAPVAIGCRDDSTWGVTHLALTAGAQPSFQWISSAQFTWGGDEVLIADVTLEGAMVKGLPPLQFDSYRTFGKSRSWCTMTDPTCYSPTQNVHRAYDAGSVGCPCSAASGVCVSFDNAGREHSVALVCEGDKWQSVIDGPCWFGPASVDAPIIVPAIPDSAKLLPWESFGVLASQPATEVLTRLTASVAGQTYPVTLTPAPAPMASRQISVHASDWGALMGKTLYVREPNESKVDLAYGFAQLPILATYTGENLGQLVHNSGASLSTVDGATILSMDPQDCPGSTTYAAGRLSTTDKSKVVISMRESWITLTPPTLVRRDGTIVSFTRVSETPVADSGRDVVFEVSVGGQSEVGVEVTARGACPPVGGAVLKSIVTQ